VSEISSGTRAGYIEFFAGLAQREEIDRSNAKAYLQAGSRVMSVEPDAAAVDVRDLNVDEMLARFEAQNPDYSPESIKTYRSRFRVGVAMYRAFLDGDADWKNAGRSIAAREAAFAAGQGRGRAPQDGESPGRIVAYDLPLRPDLLVRINLPIDLTTADADRVAAFVRSLAFDPPAGNPVAAP
jgi:hypothetical protein